MERLKNYCVEIRDIDGIKTYIVSPEYLDTILSDSDLLSSLFTTSKRIQYLVNEAKENPSKIFFAFSQHNNRKIEKFVWEPVNCYKDGQVYYHIAIRDTWMCRECKQMHQGKFIMLMSEHEPIFYSGADNKYPSIPSVFKRRICSNCGKTLQNHFVSITDN